MMFDSYFSKFPTPGSPEATRQLAIAGIIAVIVIAVLSFLLIYSRVKINSAPEQTSRAEVVEKSSQKQRSGGSRRLLIFKLSDGTRKSFVNSKFFDTINEDDKGVLTFKETKSLITNNSLIISYEKD